MDQLPSSADICKTVGSLKHEVDIYFNIFHFYLELYLRKSLPYKRLLQIFDPTDIVPISLTLDQPYNMMEKPKFYAVANYRNSSGSYDSAVLILRYNYTTDNFTIHQYLDEYAPYELESFSGKVNMLAHKNFLSVAGKLELISKSFLMAYFESCSCYFLCSTYYEHS